MMMLRRFAFRRSRDLPVLLACLALTLAAIPFAAQAAPADFANVNTVIELDEPLYYGEYVWDEEGAPAGSLKVVVDLENELLYVYRGGVEIGRATILYGADHKPTPTGVFPILEKRKDHISNIYHLPMPYMLRLTWGGIAIHGSEVEEGYATHGCVGLPEEFAAILFAQAKVGDRVLITNNWLPDAYSDQAIDPAEL